MPPSTTPARLPGSLLWVLGSWQVPCSAPDSDATRALSTARIPCSAILSPHLRGLLVALPLRLQQRLNQRLFHSLLGHLLGLGVKRAVSSTHASPLLGERLPEGPGRDQPHAHMGWDTARMEMIGGEVGALAGHPVVSTELGRARIATVEVHIPAMLIPRQATRAGASSPPRSAGTSRIPGGAGNPSPRPGRAAGGGRPIPPRGGGACRGLISSAAAILG